MKVVLVLFLLLGGFSGQTLAENRGESAMDCLIVSDGAEQPSGVEIVFTNQCDEQIFMLWCGELQFSERRCGDGPNGGFYTQSDNLQANASNEIRIKAGTSYHYAACYGGISFGNSGEYTDNPDGGFVCLPTGSYKQDSEENGQ